MINLKYWKCKIGEGNFGDELSPLIVSHYANPRYKIRYNLPGKSLIAIGSYIDMANTGDIIWGSGVRKQPFHGTHNYSNLNVRAVRGHLTKEFLEKRNIKVPNVFGDPALLLPRILSYNPISELKDKIGIVPHFTHRHDFVKYKNDYVIIDPLDKCEEVVRKIYSCKAIISSSLHGLIVSDTYNIPNVWLRQAFCEGDFKYHDYFSSQGREISFISTIEEFEESKLYTEGNKVDLDKLVSAFPYLN